MNVTVGCVELQHERALSPANDAACFSSTDISKLYVYTIDCEFDAPWAVSRGQSWSVVVSCGQSS